MAVISTTLSEHYQPKLTVAWALREIISNALDGEARGKGDGVGQMSYAYSPKTRVLTVTNAGVGVPASALLLGTSESRGREDCIGTFGEGLPMALLVLSRNHYPVVIHNGLERWEPVIEAHPEMGERVLQIKMRQLVKDRNGFSVEIGQIESADYTELCSMFLRFDPSFEEDRTISAGDGQRVLLQTSMRGRLYNRGVFVCAKPKLMFGYDLRVELNRDRNMMDEWQLKDQLSSLLVAAVAADRGRFLPMLEAAAFSSEDSIEALDSYSNIRFDSGIRSYFVRRFVERYGDNAIPVAGAAGVEQAGLHGYRGVVVNPLLRSLLDRNLLTLDIVKSMAAMRITKIYPMGSDAWPKAKQDMCLALINKITVSYPFPSGIALSVVDFGSETTRSKTIKDAANQPVICLPLWLLSDPAAVLTAIVRELVIEKRIEVDSKDTSASVVAVLANLAVRGV